VVDQELDHDNLVDRHRELRAKAPQMPASPVGVQPRYL
jgi:hypothetical protein